MSLPLTCIAIDDEPLALDVLRDYARLTPALHLTHTFQDAIQALTYLQAHPVDLLFLDVNMPDLSGIQLLKALRHPPLVVFTTAYTEYAVKSYDFDAVDYLLKPIEFDRFLRAVHKATDALPRPSPAPVAPSAAPLPSPEFVFLKSGPQLVRLRLDEILYVEADRNYCTFVTTMRKVSVLMTLQEAAALLPAAHFVRVHKSFIVALRQVQLIERHQVQVGPAVLPVGKAFWEQLYRAAQAG
ncbi:LytR/AlgR family response regulator transcription factor [Hymenobacter cellulosivorans]|uniref:Response regulator transcription factor n=1 Tax=Hymenobacter cellulosivorans TaxID=2932249 RepID=A0ABY4F5U2_9BACT|nr:response regulator transcription factor [Hymenobacter cellulosivorans]UOQ52043.1 response regulator transcription factor [Hymenobacter cellulosivorans]